MIKGGDRGFEDAQNVAVLCNDPTRLSPGVVEHIDPIGLAEVPRELPERPCSARSNPILRYIVSSFKDANSDPLHIQLRIAEKDEDHADDKTAPFGLEHQPPILVCREDRLDPHRLVGVNRGIEPVLDTLHGLKVGVLLGELFLPLDAL